MSECKDGNADDHRKFTVQFGLKVVKIEEYPGGDMSIDVPQNEIIYLTSEQAAALREAFSRLEAYKRHEADHD